MKKENIYKRYPSVLNITRQFTQLGLYLQAHPKIVQEFQARIIEQYKDITVIQRERVEWEYKTLTKKLSSGERMLWWALQNKWKYRKGQFYYQDKRLSLETGLSIATIKRAKKTLQYKGKIKYKSGLYEGAATIYEYIERVKMTSSNNKRGSPCKQEGVILLHRRGHPEPPLNIIKDNNKTLRFNPEVCKLIKETAQKKLDAQ